MCCFLMLRPPPTSTRTDTSFPTRRSSDLHLPRNLIEAVLTRMTAMLEEGIDRMKTQADDITLIAAGGGAFLIPEKLSGVGRVLHVKHSSVANDVGAAIAQVSGEVDQVFNGLTRDQDRKSTRLTASHSCASRLPSSA